MCSRRSHPDPERNEEWDLVLRSFKSRSYARSRSHQDDCVFYIPTTLNDAVPNPTTLAVTVASPGVVAVVNATSA